MRFARAAHWALGILLIVLGLATFVASLRLFVPYQYEPLGPKVFPALIASILTVAGLLLCRLNTAEVEGVTTRQVLLAVFLFAYALAFDWLGMPLATALVVLAMARLLHASWTLAALCAVAIAGGTYVILFLLLQLPLPLGALWTY